MPKPPTFEQITGSVLAGGEGRRMGGIDKGLVPLAGKPLVAWGLDALRVQTGAQLINANRSLDEYRAFDVPVVSDSGDGFQGPLAGIHAVLAVAQTEFVLAVPCDAPRVPPDLAARLGQALAENDAEIAIVEAAGRLHPVHALMRAKLAADLAAALADGERKVLRWQESRRLTVVDCSDIADAFVNVNTPEQVEQLERQLAEQERS